MCQLQLLLLMILLITVLVSHNVMCQGSYNFLSPQLPLTGFQQACCFTGNNLSTFFCSDITDYCKNNAFFKKNKFFVPTYCWWVSILVSCVYVLFRALFHSSAI